jgi:hypothetical protein
MQPCNLHRWACAPVNSPRTEGPDRCLGKREGEGRAPRAKPIPAPTHPQRADKPVVTTTRHIEKSPSKHESWPAPTAWTRSHLQPRATDRQTLQVHHEPETPGNRQANTPSPSRACNPGQQTGKHSKSTSRACNPARQQTRQTLQFGRSPPFQSVWPKPTVSISLAEARRFNQR